ncbi:MAG: POTRA domain-containing protein [Anaeromyxobacter sp.]
MPEPSDWPAGAAAPDASGGAQVRVAEVVLALPAPDEEAAALVGIGAGDWLSARALRQAVQRLHQTGRYRTIRILAEPAQAPGGQLPGGQAPGGQAPGGQAPGGQSPGGQAGEGSDAGGWVRLRVEATAVRRISRVTLRGAGAAGLDEPALRGLVRFAAGDPFEQEDVPAAEARLRDALARRGHRSARVMVTARGENPVAVEVSVEPGPVTRVTAVALAGNPGLPQEALERLATRPGGALDEDLLADDARTLRLVLHQAGWRRATVGTPQVSVEGQQAEVAFPVTAGPRVTVGFRGNAALPDATLERELALDPEQPLDAGALETATDRLLAAYRVRGYAAVRTEVEEEARGDRLAVVFRIEEGVRYRVQAIRFPGVTVRSEAWLRERLVAVLREEDPPQRSQEADAARSLAVALPGEADSARWRRCRCRPVSTSTRPHGIAPPSSWWTPTAPRATWTQSTWAAPSRSTPGCGRPR